MATPSAAQPRDLQARLKRLEQEVHELRSLAMRRPPLEVTSGDFVVSGGGYVDVRDGGTVLIRYPNNDPQAAVVMGDILNTSTEAYLGTGLLMQRDDHEHLAFFVHPDTGAVTGYIEDVDGVRVLELDSNGGLARPNDTIALYKANSVDAFATSSASFVSAYQGYATLWSPRLALKVIAYAGGGNTGEIRVQVNGTTIGTVNAFSTSVFMDWVEPVPSFTPGLQYQIDVQIRRTAGAGTVAVVPLMCRGGAS